MRIDIPIKLKAEGAGKTNHRAVRLVQCVLSNDCPTMDCPHRNPHPCAKLSDGYRCDQYKRKDLAEKRCANSGVRGAYCSSIKKV